MTRERISTTVDDRLLSEALGLLPWKNNASMFDAALKALVTQHRAAEIDQSYAAYEQRPLDEPDEWGSLAAFREAAAVS